MVVRELIRMSRINPTFVNLKDDPIDYETYAYAICECHSTLHAIRLNRIIGFHKFKCPNCGKELGLNITKGHISSEFIRGMTNYTLFAKGD